MRLAARGQRDTEGGPEQITDRTERSRLARQARTVHLESLVTAAVVTALLLALP